MMRLLPTDSHLLQDIEINTENLTLYEQYRKVLYHLLSDCSLTSKDRIFSRGHYLYEVEGVLYSITLTNDLLKHRDDQYYVVKEWLCQSGNIRKAIVSGNIECNDLKTTTKYGDLDHCPTVITALAPINPLQMSSEESALLGTCLPSAYHALKMNFFEYCKDGYCNDFKTEDGQTIFYFSLTHRMFIRPRAHREDELRVEAITKFLGEGNYAKVFKLVTFAINHEHQLTREREDLVVRMIAPQNEESLKSQLASAHREHLFLSRFMDRSTKKPFLVSINGVNHILKIEAFCPGTTLKKIIDDESQLLMPIDTNERLMMTKQLFAEANNVHAAGIRHRDLKPANTLVRRGGIVPKIRIIDFGLSLWHDQNKKEKGLCFAGTPAFIAPEMWDKETLGSLNSEAFACGFAAATVWGANVKFPIRKKKEDVAFLSHHQYFFGLFSEELNHDLTEKEMPKLHELFYGTVVCDEGKRTSTLEAEAIIDDIILERRLMAFPADTHEEMRKVQIAAISLRQKINRYLSSQSGEFQLNNSIWFLQNFRDALQALPSLPNYVALFTEVVGIEALRSVSTPRGLIELLTEIFMDYFEIERKLKKLDEACISFFNKPIAACLSYIPERKKVVLTIDNIVMLTKKLKKETDWVEAELTKLRKENGFDDDEELSLDSSIEFDESDGDEVCHDSPSASDSSTDSLEEDLAKLAPRLNW